jgi:hypothetical protein
VYDSPISGPPVRSCGLIVNHPTFSYKRLGWTPLSSDQKKKRLRLEHNATQFPYGCSVLRSCGPNHVNHHVHHVHLELTIKRLKTFPIKEPQRAALKQLWWKCLKITSTVVLSHPFKPNFLLLASMCDLLYGCCSVELSDLDLLQRQISFLCLSADGNLTSCLPWDWFEILHWCL